jgi:hypothetical protein
VRTVLTVVVGAAWLLAAEPGLPHHSFTAEFDVNRPFELTGTVSSVEWTNPHAWLFVEIEDDQGSAQSWAIELLGINALMRRGLTRDSIGPGDVITVVGFGSRDGTNTGNASMVTMTDTGQLLWESTAGDRN